MAGAGPSLTIRPAVTVDLAAILELNRATQAEHEHRLPDWFIHRETTALQQVFRKLLTEGVSQAEGQEVFVLVADLDGQVQGHVLCHCGPPAQTAGLQDRYGSIWDISVRAEAQRQRVGQRLLDAAISRMRETGCTVIRAEVWRGNIASAALFDSRRFDAAYIEYRLRLSVRVMGMVQPVTLLQKLHRNWPVLLAGAGLAIAGAAAWLGR
ncbi:hypothetical protein MASR1M32_14820 [Rhodobacter sp.]